jgi:hypothetical protein
VGRLEPDLFGRQVPGCAAQHGSRRALGRSRIERHAEVREVGVPLLVKQDVAGLHVTVHHPLTVGRRERRGDLIQDRRDPIDSEGFLRDQVLNAATAEEPHHQVRAVGLSPIVVQRHDVGMLEASDDLRLALEPPNKVRMVGQLRVNRLDGDLSADQRLGRSVDRPERSLSHLLEQSVAAQRLAREVEVGILPKDPLVETLQIRRWVHAELVGEDFAQPLVRRQRVGLPAGAIEPEDQMPQQSLAQRMFAGEGLELAENLQVAAELEVRIDTFLECLETEIVQASDLAGERSLGCKVCVGRTPPQFESLPQKRCGSIGLISRLPGLPHQMLERRRIELAGLEMENVAGSASLEPTGAEGFAKM